MAVPPRARVSRKLKLKKTEDPTVGLTCDLCHTDLSGKADQSEVDKLNRKEHYVKICPAVPGAVPSGRYSRKEILERIASLALIKKVGKSCISTNKDVKRVYVFTGSTDTSTSMKNGGPRPCEKPPD